MEDRFIPRQSVPVTISLADRRNISGTIQIDLDTKLANFLNYDEAYLVIKDKDSTLKLLNKDHIIDIRPQESTSQSSLTTTPQDEGYIAPQKVSVTISLLDGRHLTGEIDIDMGTRFSDFMNLPERYLVLRDSAKTIRIINKKHIVELRF
jgi:hypothetical protein